MARLAEWVYGGCLSTSWRARVFYKVRGRLTYANVMATIAVFVALGGSSYAALQVTGKNVKDSSLTGRDIKNSSLTTSDVKNRSLLSQDFKAGQLPAGPKGDTGPQGPKGDPGAPGQNGTNGSSAASALGGGGFVPSPGFSTAQTTYCSPDEVQAGNSCTADEATQQNTLAFLSPNATIVARDLFVRQAGAAFTSRTYALRVEGTDTAVACTLAGDTQTTCNSGAATATIPPGSRILLKVDSSANALANGFWFGWRATTP